jgi:hypothetical protein
LVLSGGLLAELKALAFTLSSDMVLLTLAKVMSASALSQIVWRNTCVVKDTNVGWTLALTNAGDTPPNKI